MFLNQTPDSKVTKLNFDYLSNAVHRSLCFVFIGRFACPANGIVEKPRDGFSQLLGTPPNFEVFAASSENLLAVEPYPEKGSLRTRRRLFRKTATQPASSSGSSIGRVGSSMSM